MTTDDIDLYELVKSAVDEGLRNATPEQVADMIFEPYRSIQK